MYALYHSRPREDSPLGAKGFVVQFGSLQTALPCSLLAALRAQLSQLLDSRPSASLPHTLPAAFTESKQKMTPGQEPTPPARPAICPGGHAQDRAAGAVRPARGVTTSPLNRKRTFSCCKTSLSGLSRLPELAPSFSVGFLLRPSSHRRLGDRVMLSTRARCPRQDS